MTDIFSVKSPGDYIREELSKREWTQADLAIILKRPLPTVNRILQGKHGLMPEMAISLGEAFGTGPEVWMERESRFRLSQAEPKDENVARRARLYELAPINEMKKRGWLPKTNNFEEIEKSLQSHFHINSIEDEPKINPVMRKSDPQVLDLSPAQKAWCFRVHNLASLVPANKFSPSNLSKCQLELRNLAAHPQDARRVGEVLANYGIRFVVVEHLSSTKIDGATMWIDEDQPVIGMSIRYNRIDNFWFTLFHELSHVRHRDVSVDSDISGGETLHVTVKPEFERRADEESSNAIVDPAVLKSFILRVGPLYSKTKIIQFAHKVKIHPGLIVGQLHARNEFRSGYKACREMLVKIREIVTDQALTDGWGHSIELKE